MEPVVCITM